MGYETRVMLSEEMYVDVYSWRNFNVDFIFKDGKIEAEDFTSRLYRELNSSPQPYLVPFLKVIVKPPGACTCTRGGGFVPREEWGSRLSQVFESTAPCDRSSSFLFRGFSGCYETPDAVASLLCHASEAQGKPQGGV